MSKLLVKHDNSTRRLPIIWPEGFTSEYPYIWLRHYLFHPATGRSEQGADDDCLIIEPIEVAELAEAVLQENLLILRWANDGAETRHDLSSLRKSCLMEKSRSERRRVPILWSKLEAKEFPWIKVSELEKPIKRFHIFRHLRDFGIILLDGLGNAPGTLLNIAPYFGPIRRTHYGELFDVRSLPKDNSGEGENIGATASNSQAPHIDEDYRDNIPGISFFHCIKSAPHDRGASIYLDGFAASERLRERDPRSFKFLTSVPLMSKADRNPLERFRSRTRSIAVDDDDVVRGVSMSDRVLPPLDLPIELIEPAYQALASFQKEIYDYSKALELVLKPGQCVVFDNQRILHTRRSFDPSIGERWMQQLSVDRDEFNNSLQVLALQTGHPKEAEYEQDSGLLTQVRLPIKTTRSSQ